MKTENNNSFPKDSLSNFDSFYDDTKYEWYAAKHRKPSPAELSLVNGLSIECCPHCGGTHFKKSGYYGNGTRRYRCLDCGKAFSPLTGTVFDAHKIPISEWIEYMIHLFEFHSLSSSARDNRNAKTTGKYWISKVFAVLSDSQKDILLSGRIYLDETYFPIMPKDESRKSDGKHYRGISRNKICVVTATDGTDVFLAVCGRAKPSRARILDAFEGHIKSGSVLIHDGENSHKILIETFGLTEEVYTTKATHNLSDDDNPMEPINAVHRSLKRFMRQHPAYDRDDLQDWLNLFRFIYTNRGISMDDKVKKFLRMAVLTRKVIRFRAVFAKKTEK